MRLVKIVHRWNEHIRKWTCTRCNETHDDPCACGCHDLYWNNGKLVHKSNRPVEPLISLDDYGCPSVVDGELSARLCPPEPCFYCTGLSAVREGKRYMTSWEWCRWANTCAATIDWDRVFSHES